MIACAVILVWSSGCAGGPVADSFCALYQLDSNPVSAEAVSNNATYLCRCPNDAPEELVGDLC